MLVLASGYHELESIGFFIAKFDAYFILSHGKSLANRLTREHLCVERLGEADCGQVENRLALLAADDVRYITLLEDFSNELRHARCHEHDLDLGCRLLQYFAELALAD